MEIRINRMGINGEGIGHSNQKPVFVPEALPEETVDIEITEDRGRYSFAKVNQIIKPSPFRKEPECKVQRACGGCPLMILDYKQQLLEKRKLVQEALVKYAGMDSRMVEEVRPNPNPLHYRNLLKLPVKQGKNGLESGLFKSGSNILIPMEVCWVHEKELELKRREVLQVINEHGLRDYNDRVQRGVRMIVLRGFHGRFQCTLITGRDSISEECAQDILAIPGMASLFQNINYQRKSVDIFGREWKHLGGSKTLELRLGKILMRLSPSAFFQLNTVQAENLYQAVYDLVEPSKVLVEAYCGIGGISLYLKDKAEQIYGIEYAKEAVKNAENNARLNRAGHLKFVSGDAAEEMTKISKKTAIDTVVADPPRSGLDEKMIACLLKSKPKQIVYVSCNPATLAKNLKELSGQYEVKRIIPFDMFSQGAHVETVCLLVRKH